MPAQHILLVEDDPDLVSMLTEALEQEGYRVSAELIERVRSGDWSPGRGAKASGPRWRRRRFHGQTSWQISQP